MSDQSSQKRVTPTWLVGLVIALVVFAIVILVARLLGYGDDPSIGAMVPIVNI